jgi:hypothetical protein
MILLRLLNPQGIAGLAATLCLGLLLILQKGETRHWRKQSASLEKLYRGEQAAFAETVASYRAAADRARLADQANADRVATEQRAINERISHDYDTRLAAARSLAQRLRVQAASARADPGRRAGAAMPALPASSSGASQGSRENRLPDSDALTATEQAIQLDELIEWVKAQAAVEPRTDSK